jgi:peptidoglycan/LPS O-acetylase OafA/YrhL
MSSQRHLAITRRNDMERISPPGSAVADGSPTVRPRFYVAPLDGIRAVAIAGVFALHLDRPDFPGGAFGVDVFFVLSAYLITTILLRELRDRARMDFPAFYWRRVIRLGPALLLWLVLVATPTALLQHAGSQIPWSTAGVLFYFSDFLEALTPHIGTAYDQSWSLAVEEQFYLVWPLLLVLLTKYLRPSLQRYSIAALVAGSIVLLFAGPSYFLPTAHLAALALGCWAAFYAIDTRDGWVVTLIGDTRTAVTCVAVFALAIFVTPRASLGSGLALLVDIAAMVLTLHCTFADRSVVSRALGSTVLRWIGERSYGIYLYGLTLMQFIPLVTHVSLRYAGPIDIVATGLVVAASYRYVEAPVRAHGRRVLARRQLLRRPDVGLPVIGVQPE